MRLKSLKLAGFKSFANPTTFSFKHDITAIVGPNGCGKSNVIDAMRWVLGESSAKQLRGGAMSDVIFAGTDGKAGKSMASVELTFEHTQDEKTGIRHALNLYHELTLRRQVTLDGKSDYFINGQRVRRRDVVDVFLGTGLGARSYAVIEQGMIGRIIEADGAKLREFIEEAAGVSRYQARRDETEKQLGKARENLERLNDLQGELQKQHKTLKRQAETALRYQDIKGALQKVEWRIFEHKLYEAHKAYEAKLASQNSVSAKLTTMTQEMATLRSRWDAIASKTAEIQWQKEEAVREHHQAVLVEQSAKHALEVAQAEEAQAKEAIWQLTQEEAQAQNLRTQKLSEQQEHAQALQTLDARVQALNEQMEAIGRTQGGDEHEWQTLRQTLSALYSERQQYQNSLTISQAQLTRIDTNLQKWQQKQQALIQEMAALAQVDESALQALEEQLTSFGERLTWLEQETEESRSKLTVLAQTIAETQTAIAKLEKQHSALQSEYDTRHKLAYPPKPQAAQKTATTTLPTLQECLRLTKMGESYAKVLDKFLGSLLGDGILAQEMPMTMLLDSHLLGGWYKGDLSAEYEHIGTPLTALIEAPSLPLWSHVVLLEDDKAKTLTLTDIQGVVITPSGWVLCRFGAWHMDKFGKEQSQFISQRQAHLERLAELEEALETLEAQLEVLNTTQKQDTAQKDALAIIFEEQQAQLSAVNKAYQDAKHQQINLRAKVEQARQQQAHHHQRQAQLQQEQEELLTEKQALELTCAQSESLLAKLAPDITAAKQRLSLLENAQKQQQHTLSALQQEIHKQRLEHHSHTQALMHIQTVLSQLESAETQKEETKRVLTTKLDTLANQLPMLQAAYKQSSKQAYERQVHSESYEHSLHALQQEQAQIQAARSTQQEQIDKLNSQLTALGAEVAVALARVQSLGEQLGERNADFNLNSRLNDFGHANFRLTGELATLLTEQKQLGAQLSGLGAVNLAAAQELSELEERLLPLLKEIQDVQDSITTLQNAIDTINQKTKKLFLQTLASVNQQLGVLFAKVFGGGQASLTLMEDESLPKMDKWRAGLVLMAQPKGKKNSRLAVLSGGEKTLTALSLIFAIFKQNPAPFCVLDEVDAPLDDANVGRFTGLIGELANEVQFIFISHNKLAMQTAQELKGITMPTAGISTLVSVNLDEAMQMVG